MIRPIFPLLLVLLLFVAQLGRADEPWPSLYNPFRVQTIHLEIDPVKWNAILRDTNYYDPVLNIREPCQLWMDGETAPNSLASSITVQVRRKSDPALPDEGNPVKVSLKIDVNEYVAGQSIRGVKKLSLENGAGGNGVLREGFAMNMHRLAADAGFYPLQVGNASWVRLVVNGAFIGIYSCPEQRDVTFLKNRGMFKEKASWLYEINGGIFLDTSVATGHSPTHQHLNYPPFRIEASQPMSYEEDVQEWVDMKALLTLASIESFISNTDGLFTKSASNQGKNSFCVDWLPPNKAKRVYLPWDLDGGFSNATWNIFSGGSGQQAQRRYQTQILQHPWFGEYYRHVYTELLDGPLSTVAMNAWLDQLESVLSPAMAQDPYADAGGFFSLRAWLATRSANVRTQIGTIIQPPTFSPLPGLITPGTQFTLAHANTAGTSTMYYTTDGSDPRAPGGAPSTSAQIFTGAVTMNGSMLLRARVRNVNGGTTRWSGLREANYDVLEALATLRLTEIHFKPSAIVGFEDADEAEFLEFKNTGGVPLALGNCTLNGVEWNFAPGTTVNPGGFLVITANPAAFAQRYPGIPFHTVFWRNLSNDGEKLRLRNASGSTVISCDFASNGTWQRGAEAFGRSFVNINYPGDPDNPDHWRASTNIGGSPGSDDPPPTWAQGIVINEVIAKTSNPLEDAVELHNTGTTPADISGWWLSDDYDPVLDPGLVALRKFRIPEGTAVPAGGHVVFYQESFGGAAAASPFSLTQDGETVFLSSASPEGVLTGFIGAQPYHASETNTAQGRIPISTGWDFAALRAQTFGVSNPVDRPAFRLGMGMTNANPIVGPVIISEISYQPAAGGFEYVELGNTGTLPAQIGGWRLEGAGGFVFPTGTTLAPGAVLLVADVPDGPAFRAALNIPAAAMIFPHLFDLDDAGEDVELLKPNQESLRPMIRVERIRYNDKAPWPTSPAGLGSTLERKTCFAYGNDPLNWVASAPGGSAGSWGCTVINSDADNDGLPDSWETSNGLNPADPLDAVGDADGDGAINTFEYLAGTDPRDSASLLHLEAIDHTAAGQTVRFPSVSGKNYRILSSGDLSNWQPLGSAILGTGEEIEVTDPLAQPGSRRFYRIVLE